MPRKKFAWASLPDEELLEVRLKDLRVTVDGTWLEDCLLTLHDELAQSGVRVRPHAWISSEWFSPDSTPGIGIPFYLAHPRLMRLERKMIIDVEGGTWAECMAILRHEAGHVVQPGDARFLGQVGGTRMVPGNVRRQAALRHRPRETAVNQERTGFVQEVDQMIQPVGRHVRQPCRLQFLEAFLSEHDRDSLSVRDVLPLTRLGWEPKPTALCREFRAIAE